jgi:hypothetical protein
VIGKTAVAARLLRYTEKEKAGGTEPRVLYSEGIRCRVPTAEREFAAVRRTHGKQGAKRKVATKYELPEPDEFATHIRRSRPNGRKYWAAAAASETATHVRREGDGYVDEIQAVHVIISFGLDEVNPDDPMQVRKAFEFVTMMMTELYPGVQMKLVGQADGTGTATPDGPGKAMFHVHCVANAVVTERMEVDGHVWEAGRKMSGALTDIARLRERADEFIVQHGADYGIEQKLPSVSEQKREKRSTRDRRMAAKGDISNHDIIRSAFEDSMNDARSIDLGSFVAVMAEHDVAVNHRVTRAGQAGEKHALSYRLDSMKTPVRGTTLGDHFAFESSVEQLAANATGLQREGRAAPRHAGTPRSLSEVTSQELAAAQAVVERLATEERFAQAEDQAAADFLAATIEDFDGASEAYRGGDIDELARLANLTRAKQKPKGAKRGKNGGIPSPDDARHTQPPPSPEPQQHAPAQKSAQVEPLTEKWVRASLDEVDEQTEGVFQHHAEVAAAIEDSTTVPVPGGAPLSAPRRAQEPQGAAAMPPVAMSEPNTAGSISQAQAAEEDAETLRKINRRNRVLGLPSVTADQLAARQSMTPAQRKRQLEQPELFDAPESSAESSKRDQGFAG